MTHVAHALRIASTVACGIVIAAFVFWAGDGARSGSESQVAGLDDAAAQPAAITPAGQTTPAPESERGAFRGAIEDANETLLSPFDHIADDRGKWAERAVPVLLALLSYGLLARMLIPYLVDERRTR